MKLAGTTDSKAINEALWNVDYTACRRNQVCRARRCGAQRGLLKTANTETGSWDFVTVQSVD
jgi:hypothetical protein